MANYTFPFATVWLIYFKLINRTPVLWVKLFDGFFEVARLFNDVQRLKILTSAQAEFISLAAKDQSDQQWWAQLSKKFRSQTNNSLNNNHRSTNAELISKLAEANALTVEMKTCC